MKIDLHCHTKKTKSGDPETRNVQPTVFADVLSTNMVKIVAITNHNYFDLDEYDEFKQASSAKDVQVWPGVEFDVSIEGEKGHILVIANPGEANSFEQAVKTLLNGVEPDLVLLDYKEMARKLRNLDIVLIAHYALLKQDGFSDKAINKLKNEMSDDDVPVLLEPSSLKSVGIMEANGLEGMIGSDVQDWSSYPSYKIPSLKMPIRDYRTFKLLLKKDRNVVDSFINQKTKSPITIIPFSDEGDFREITLDIYNDVNVVFGGKATGKSKIVESIRNHYLEKGKSNQIAFYKANSTIEKYKEITKTSVSEALFNVSGFSDHKSEIDLIKGFKSPDIVSTDKFFKGVKSLKAKGKISSFGFFKASFSYVEDDSLHKKAIADYLSAKESFAKLKAITLEKYVSKEYAGDLLKKVVSLEKEILKVSKNAWIDNKASYCLQWTINTMKAIGKIKSGETALPTNTGLCQLYSELKKLKYAAQAVADELSIRHKPNYSLIGLLPDKNEVYKCTDCYIDPLEKGFDSKKVKFLSPNVGIMQLRDFKKAVNELNGAVFTPQAVEKVNHFITKASGINSLKDCFFVDGYTVIKKGDSYEKYEPSDGEKSMLQIYNVFSNDSKEIYILDEPELSVGHNYINNVIVPKIRDLSRLDKTVIISTHDANIAVRTLPLNTIYREHNKTYKTFVGNLFLNELRCVEDGTVYSWSEKSLEYLEGGEDAFLERGDSYGI